MARLLIFVKKSMPVSIFLMAVFFLLGNHLQEGYASKQTAIPGYKTVYEILTPSKKDSTMVKKSDPVTVHATGVVKESGKKFWSTKDAGQQPFSYTAGVGGVITGWDQGLLGAKLGEVRKVTIPAEEGYGAGGFPAWGIPAGATLEFTLEVLQIGNEKKDEL